MSMKLTCLALLCAATAVMSGCINYYAMNGDGRCIYVETDDEPATTIVYHHRRIGAIRMAKNMKYCRPSDDGKSLEYAPVIYPPQTSEPTEWEHNEHGYYRYGIKPPEPPDGKIVSSVTYRVDSLENATVADYEYEDAPKPVRTFSKLKLYGALVQAGLWDRFEAWLKDQTIKGVSAYTAFTLAQDLNDANEMFNSVVESAKQALGVSDEVVEMILEASIQEL